MTNNHPKISICLNTWQELYPMYGINKDIFTLIIEQLENQSFQDFELIIVDRLFGERKQSFENIKKPFKIKYLPQKPSPWINNVDKNAITISNAKNTALLFAEGDWIIFIDDCEIPMHYKWLEQIHSHAYYQNRTLRPLAHTYDYRARPPKIDQDPLVGWLEKEKKTKVDYHKVSGHGKAYSFPALVYEFLNGFDERFDGGWGSEDCNFYERIDKFNYSRWILGNEEQYHLALIIHHPTKAYSRHMTHICNQAYALLTYHKINQHRELQANVKNLDKSDIDFIKSVCKNCEYKKLVGCEFNEPPNLHYYLEIQPVFSLADQRREMLSSFKNKYGAFDPWS